MRAIRCYTPGLGVFVCRSMKYEIDIELHGHYCIITIISDIAVVVVIVENNSLEHCNKSEQNKNTDFFLRELST